MSNAKKIIRTALASIVSLGVLGASEQAIAADPPVYIKCYGVAAANKNDCGSVAAACAATVPQARACYAWIYAPKGICEKIAGSSVDKPAADCKGPNGKLVQK